MTLIAKRNIIKQIIYTLLGATFITLALCKAQATGFTHDESYTYLNFTKDSFIDIISLKNSFTNNHPINTLLMKYSEQLFGNDELALRTPNILALLLVLIIIHKINVKKGIEILVLTLTGILCVNEIFDYYSLARGYGLSIAFMLWSLYYASKLIKESNWKLSIGFHGFAILASLSQFTTLSYYAATGIALSILILLQIENKKQAFKILLSPLVLTIIILYEPLRRVSGEAFDFGGERGVIDTLYSIVNFIFNSTPTNEFIKNGVLIIIGLSLTYSLVRGLMKGSNERESVSLFYTLVLILILVVLITLFQINIIEYPTGRLAMFIYPLVILQFVSVMRIGVFQKISKEMKPLLIFIAVFWFIRFAINFQMQYFPLWKYDRYAKEVLSIVEKNKVNTSQSNKTKISIDWILEPTLNYYRKKNDLIWLEEFDRAGIDTLHAQFIYTQSYSTLGSYRKIHIFQNPTSYLFIKNQ